MKKIVNFQTKDGVKIVGDFYPVKTDKSVLLMHILPGDRRDFSEFAEFLWGNGYNVLNIDERGHGESEAWPGEMGSWQEFVQTDYDKMIYDAEAAARYLGNKIPEIKLALIGGSIGANVSLIFGAKHQPKAVVALSPGLNYCGIKTEIAVRNYRQNFLLVASADDVYAFESSEKLFEISTASHKEFFRYKNAGHGTRMFGAEPKLKQQVLDFLNNSMIL
ncbi:MAG: alpha/beta fold hydrolase [Candidatus Azambacteria bacterium]|nr:alpha/beta fold hydrolase [Candidatus Azambacteria bacterium]